MEEAPYPLMITYMSIPQLFNQVAWYQQRGYSSHFTVLLQNLIETKYKRGKFSAYNIGSIQPQLLL